MDRFIGIPKLYKSGNIGGLKSNMDRFIVNKHPELNTTDQV